MRLQRSPGMAAVLGLIVCVCAFHTTTAFDIPLEGECFNDYSLKVHYAAFLNKACKQTKRQSSWCKKEMVVCRS